MKFNIVTYIKPTDDFEMFAKCLANIQKSIYLNKIFISFVENLSSEFIKELEKYDNIIWKDGVDKYWAVEIKTLIENNPSDYYYTWEEDSYIYNIKQFDKTFKRLVKKEINYMLTLDLKWIERANFLLNNNLAIKEDEFIYFNWGTNYAKYCRENSKNNLVKGAYPVSIGGIFSKNLLTSLLDMLIQSKYWKDITSGNFNHFHNNPKLPHSFEVFPGFWWEGKNNGYGNIEYSSMVSTIQYAEELGGRLIEKING